MRSDEGVREDQLDQDQLDQDQLDQDQVGQNRRDQGQPAADQPVGTADLVAELPRTAVAEPEPGPATSNGRSADADTGVPLFAETEVVGFRDRWRDLQAAFVDDPRQAVQHADQLAAQLMQNLAATFAEHKGDLEVQWQRGDEVATEDLRVALQRYRSFFNRLLNA